MTLLTPGEFLIELDKLFQLTKEKANFKSRKWNKKHPEGPEELQKQCKCLLRAYDGKHRKFSTKVDVKELQGRFYEQLQITLRANMDALKRREKIKSNVKSKVP